MFIYIYKHLIKFHNLKYYTPKNFFTKVMALVTNPKKALLKVKYGKAAT